MTGHDEASFEELSERWLEGDEACLDELRERAATDPAMALELRLMEQSRDEMSALDATDRAMLERVTERVSAREPARRPWLRMTMVAAAALMVLSGTAAAAYLAGTRSARPAALERPRVELQQRASEPAQQTPSPP
ncbi:MAG: hypothetical protein GXP55_25440, partial [Deltaproteobacteria bacterium]|nr:hypothetical protein [Deltaproteobacteria bacterium]